MKLEWLKAILKKIPTFIEWLSCIKNVRQTKIKVDQIEKELSDKRKEEEVDDSNVNLDSIQGRIHVNGNNNNFNITVVGDQKDKLKNIENAPLNQNVN